MKILLTYSFFLLLLLSTENAAAKSLYKFSVTAQLYTGEIGGFLQTPKGGDPVTSSYKRPTFSELSIDRNTNYAILFALIREDRLRAYFGYNYIRLHGSSILQQDLNTHGKIIHKGTLVDSNTKFDWYSFGVSYNFYFFNNKLLLAPVLEVDLLDFKYAISRYIDPRCYYQGTLRLGLYAKYLLSDKAYLTTDITTSVPFLHFSITTADLKFNFCLDKSEKYMPILFVGIGYTQINFKDKQKMPNHIQYIMNPTFIFGVQF